MRASSTFGELEMNPFAGRRPMNRILVAQRITQPQAYIQAVVAVLHWLTNYLLITVFKGPFVMIAWAYTLSTVYAFVLMVLYFWITKKGYCSLGSGFSLQAFKVRLP